jgi:hypothetical protein
MMGFDDVQSTEGCCRGCIRVDGFRFVLPILRVLTMPAIIRAVQREYGKLERPNSLDQFGPYAALVAAERVTR